jgi:hypothetical protein
VLRNCRRYGLTRSSGEAEGKAEGDLGETRVGRAGIYEFEVRVSLSYARDEI